MAPTLDRKAQLITAATAYFEGLARKDFASVPLGRNRRVPRSSDARRSGNTAHRKGCRSSLSQYTRPKSGKVRIVGHFVNEDLTAIITKGEVGVLQPACVLRVADLFEVEAEGRITAQENHFDPRPALG